jgi:hypothetical protein
MRMGQVLGRYLWHRRLASVEWRAGEWVACGEGKKEQVQGLETQVNK